MSCFYSPRTGPLLLFSPPFFSVPYHLISGSLNCPATRSGASLLACRRHLPFSTSRPFGLSSIASLSSFVHSSGVVMWRLLRHHLFSCILPLVLVMCLSCVSLPQPPPQPHTLWHLFRLIAWLVCVSLLSWMDWFCLLVTKSKSRVIRKTRWSKRGPSLSNQIAEDFFPNPGYHQIY